MSSRLVLIPLVPLGSILGMLDRKHGYIRPSRKDILPRRTLRGTPDAMDTFS